MQIRFRDAVSRNWRCFVVDEILIIDQFILHDHFNFIEHILCRGEGMSRIRSRLVCVEPVQCSSCKFLRNGPFVFLGAVLPVHQFIADFISQMDEVVMLIVVFGALDECAIHRIDECVHVVFVEGFVQVIWMTRIAQNGTIVCMTVHLIAPVSMTTFFSAPNSHATLNTTLNGNSVITPVTQFSSSHSLIS